MSRPSHRPGPPKYRKAKPPQTPDRARGPAGPAPGAAPAAAPRAAEPPSRVLTLDPLAPVICRSGRPFDDQAGPDGARFPPPSTVAGCVRTAWARETGAALGPELLRLAIAGPLLARPDGLGGLCLLAPKPADALYFGSGSEARCVRAVPKPFDPDSGCGADLPNCLLPVQLVAPEREKGGPGPAWWAWEDLLAFRLGDAELSHAQLSEGGWSPPPGERRTHVAIERATQAAESGRLFQTEGLDLSPPQGLDDDPLSGLRLLVRCAEPLSAALAHLGGERRLSALEPWPESVWPVPPAGWLADIARAGGLSLTLLAPAAFAAGFRPGWLKPGADGYLEGSPPQSSGLRLRLRAAALGRWQPHSGWDLAAQKPRAGRKLVPAGATYWFETLGEPSLEDLAQLWLSSLCDHPQDRRDGFGLALPAPWTLPQPPTHSNE